MTASIAVATKPAKAPPPKVVVIDQAVLSDARAKAARLLEKARSYIFLHYPFYSVQMCKHAMAETLQLPTMGVTPHGKMYYNPLYVSTLNYEELMGVLAHECWHPMGGHEYRYRQYIKKHSLPDDKDMRMAWNIAGDMWINDTLVACGMTLPKGAVLNPGARERTVEELMDELLKNAKGGGKGSTGQSDDRLQGDMQPGEGDGSGDEDGDDDGRALSDSELEVLEAERKATLAEAMNAAKMRGKMPGFLEEIVTKAIATKIPWYDYLERYMVERAKVEQTWAKPNRRYAPAYYMPTLDSLGTMGEIVLVIDVSGSISQRELDHYAGHIQGIVQQCRPSMCHVLYVDTQVQKHVKFDKPDELQLEFYSGGGTDMPAAFNYCEKEGIAPAVMIVLTDGYTPFGEDPGYPVFWIISGKGQQSPWGVNIYFEIEG